MGFGLPVGAWLTGPLRPWAEELLSSAALADGLFDQRRVRQEFDAFLSGRRNLQNGMWALLQFQAWRRVFM
jgi:asparagine synthase (glutamine-hydrolysing)